MPVNAKTGFWIKFLIKIIDVLIIGVFIIIGGFSMMSYNNNDVLEFKSTTMFYVFMFYIATVITTLGILLPLILGGNKISNYITRTRIQYKNKTLKQLIKKEYLFSISWILSIILITSVINHTGYKVFFSYDRTNLDSQWMTFRITLVTTFGSIIMLVQMFSLSSGLIRKDRKMFDDILSDSEVVWNKLEKKEIEINEYIKPIEVFNKPVIWLNKGDWNGK